MQFVLAATLNHMQVKLKNQKNKEEGYLRTRGTTHKKMTMKERIRTLKTRGITKCIESDYNLENYNNYETCTYKLLVGGLGCPKKTKEIQDPTKRKYKNQKKKHQTF